MKISKFDSENVMNALLTKILEEPEYSRFGFIFEMPLKDVVNKKFLGELPTELSEYANRSWSHVDFTIYNRVTKEILFGLEVDGYNYHKKGTKPVATNATEEGRAQNRRVDITARPRATYIQRDW